MITMLFIPNCSGLLPFALGGHMNFNSKASPSEGCSAFLWMGSFHKISCMGVTLSNRSNYSLQVFFHVPQSAHWIFS